MSLPPSLTLRYQETGLLGEGGFGRVVACRDRKLGRDVAIKLLHEGEIRPADRTRFEREAKVLSTLTLPGVVRIFDFGTVDGIAYLAMERLSGTALADRLEPGKTLPAAEVLKLWIGLVTTLVEVHRAGVTHRDIKPSNIWVRPGGEPVLLDFGLARAVDATLGLTTAGTLVGTVAYMAPELLTDGTVDEGTDLWALALTMFECLVDMRIHSGQKRDEELSLQLLYANVVNRRYFAFAEQALARQGPLGGILLRSLAPDPKLRPASGRALLSELTRLQRTLAQQAERPASRRFGPAAALAVGALVVAGVGLRPAPHAAPSAGLATAAPAPATHEPLPKTYRPLSEAPSLAGAESIGVRWRLKSTPRMTLASAPVLVQAAQPGEKRFFRVMEQRALYTQLMNAEPARTEYGEATSLPLRRPKPGERVVMSLMVRRLGATCAIAVSWAPNGRVRFGGTGADELWHEVDPALIQGPVNVKLELVGNPSVDVIVQGLAVHYLPSL